MAGKIKGITIEIGGDSSKLDKALRESKKHSEELQRELKGVNTLLKFDPKNTELLSQKQKILSENIDETKSRLEFLKSKQDEVTKKWENYGKKKGEIEAVEQAIDETQNELIKLKKEQEKATKAFEEGKISEEQYNAINKSVEDCENSLKGLKEQKTALNKETVSDEEFRDFQREIINTENNLKDLEKELSDFGSVGAQKVAAVGEEMKNVGDKIETAGTKFSKFSAASAAVLTASVVGASNFEDAMAKVNTIADTSNTSLDTLKTQITELSNQTGISAEEIADATYNAISAGQDTADAVNFVSNATSLARAGFTDTGSSIDLLTTIMNAYGLEASEVGKVSDILIQTQNKGKTTVAELSSAMGKVIPTANSMNVNLENLAAGYSIMTAKGIATAESTTYMNSMLNELGKGGTKVSEALKKKTGKSFQELMASGMSLGDVLKILQDYAKSTGVGFNDLWGSAEAGKAGITLLSDGADSFNKSVKGMADSTGATAGALEKLETPSQTAKVALNEVKNAGVSLGETALTSLAPIFEKISGFIKNITEKFSSLDEGTKQRMLIILGIVAAMGPLLIVIGKVVGAVGTVLTVVPKVISVVKTVMTVVKALFTLLAANPIGIVIAAIAALVAAFVGLYKHNEKFRNFVNGIWAKIKDVFGRLPSWFGEKMSAIKNKVKSGLESIKSFFSGLKLKLPNIKLPHFKLSGSFSLKPPSVPKLNIDWYAKAMDEGMILSSPTIFGVNRNGQPMGGGEVPGRSETIVGTDSLMSMIDNAVTNAVSRINLGVYVDGDNVADHFVNRLDMRFGILQAQKARGTR